MKKYKTPKRCTCVVCDGNFEGYTSRAKYCSSLCRSRAQFSRERDTLSYVVRHRYQAARNRAKYKNLDFDLSIDYLLELYEDQNGQCSLSGDLFDFDTCAEYSVSPRAMSLDRIIPEKGYTKGNVRWVTYQINMALGEYGEDALLELARKLTGALR